MLGKLQDQVQEEWSRGGWWGLRKIFTRDMPGGFFRNVGWQYGGTAAAAAVSFVYMLMLARALGVTQFGLIALGLSVATLVSQFAMLRQREMLIRYLARFHTEQDYPRMLAVAKLSLLLDGACGLLAFLVIAGISPWAAGHVLHDPHGVAVILLASLAYILQNLVSDTALGVLRLFSRFKTLAAVEFLGSTFKLAAALLAVYVLKAGVMGVLLALAATNLLVNGALLTLALAQLRTLIPLRSAAGLGLLKPYAPDIRRFLAHNYLLSLSGVAWSDLDVSLLGYFITKEAAGVYKVAKSFVVAMSQLADAVFLVVYPELARLWARREFKQLRAFTLRLSLAMFAVAVVLYGTTFFAVPWVIAWLMRAEFADAGLIFRCMGWGIILSAPFVWVYPFLLAAGRTDLNLWAALSSTVIVVLLYLTAIPYAGPVGAALVYALSMPINLALMLWLGRRAGVIFPSSIAPPVSPP